MKRIVLLFAALLLVVSLSSTAFAAGSTNCVVDDAHLLTSNAVGQLNAKAKNVAEEYQITIRILTVDSLDGMAAQRYADNYYDQNLLHLTSGNGILLVIAMNDREWAVTTNGETHSIITDSEIDDIMAEVQPELSDGNYYDAIEAFLDGVESEYRSEESAPLVRILVALVIGAAAGGIGLLIMRGGMKTAVQQHGAGSYMVDSSYNLFQCRDIYLYSHTTKVRKPENNSSGNRSRSGGGGSRGGRSGRF